MRAASVALLFLALALAGCTAEPPRLEGLPDPSAGPAAAATDLGVPGAGNVSFDAPAEWRVGQWWKVRLTGGINDRTETRAVSGDEGAAWRVDTDHPDTAYTEARFDISNVGRVRKADLAGEQAGASVLYYRWPLEANDTWTTTWDGVPRQITVLGPRPAMVNGRTLPAVALEAREGERVAVRYDYVPALGWFSRLEFPRVDGGAFVLEVVDWGRDFSGTLRTGSVEELHREGADGPLAPHASFTVPAGASFVQAEGLFAGGLVHVQVHFLAPDGSESTYAVGPCTDNCTIPFQARLNATEGEWRVLVTGLVATGQGPPARSELAVLSVEIRERPFRAPGA